METKINSKICAPQSSLVPLFEDSLEVRLELVVEERLVPQHLLISDGSGHDNIGVYWKKSIHTLYGLKHDLQLMNIYS